MTVGEKIRQRRKELGMSQVDLSIKCGYNGRPTIANIENGVRSVPRWKMQDIADALQTSVESLFGVSEEAVALAYEIMELNDSQRAQVKAFVEELKRG